jgi:NtrC-family two-component system sensor histidine kinase KinB
VTATRPRPEDFLELVQRARRGRLKLYIGFAAGVGKTYRMLEEAHALRQRGVDVVLGFVETHGRAETAALLEGLEAVPRRRVEYRGVAVEEMDVEAILARKPAVAIVDEVAHTNAPGSRRRKRHQDVTDLLDAGINVIGAVNIQHLESLNDLVERVTGVVVRETIPDAFLKQADQVVNLDLAVEDLLERLRAGKIYAADKVPWALEHFFQDGHLSTLRELALREVAESLERSEEARARSADERPAGTGFGRVMVCMSSYPPHGATLLRKGSRMAGRLNTDWFVVYVETPGEAPERIDAEAQRHLLANIERARGLGAEFVRLRARDPVTAIVDFARSHGVGHVIIGRSHQPWWRHLFGRSVPLRLVSEGQGLDVHIVSFEEKDAPLLAALIFIGAVGSLTATSLGRSAQAILRENYRSVLAAQRMVDTVGRIDRGALFCVAGEREPGLAEIAAARRAFESELHVQQGNITEPGEAEATERLVQAWTGYTGALDHFTAASDAAGVRRAYFAELRPLFAPVKENAEAILALNQDSMVHKSDAAQRAAERLNTLLLAAAALGCLVGVLASGLLTTRILRPLGVLGQAARRLGEGDSVVRARVTGKDELAQLAAEFNTMADRLQTYRESTLGELLAAHRSSQAVIDSLPDPILVVGVEGEILHLNAAAEALLALRPQTGLAGADPALRAVLDRVRAHVLGGGGPYVPKGMQEAVRVAGSDGERRLLPRGTPVYSEQGAVIGSSIVLQDVTRLLSFEELRNDLVATVAHEFRTPLTSLHMAIHLLHEQAVGTLSEKQADLVHAAREDCERLQTIVDELLDLSRIHAGRLELHRAPHDSEELVRRALEAQRAAAEARGVELVSEVLPGHGDVSVDSERIALVFANLLSNAIRHTKPGGVVRVRASGDDAGVRFEVIDRGPGVPREYRQAIFEKYFQLPDAPAGGAGLGLFIAREVVRAHGGEIGVEPGPHGGSSFWFALPRQLSS